MCYCKDKHHDGFLRVMIWVRVTELMCLAAVVARNRLLHTHALTLIRLTHALTHLIDCYTLDCYLHIIAAQSVSSAQPLLLPSPLTLLCCSAVTDTLTHSRHCALSTCKVCSSKVHTHTCEFPHLHLTLPLPLLLLYSAKCFKD